MISIHTLIISGSIWLVLSQTEPSPTVATEDTATQLISGGNIPQDIHSADALKWGELSHNQWIAEEKYQALQDTCSYKFGQVVKYETQVVAGINHKLDYTLRSSKTGCLPQICKSTVWE